MKDESSSALIEIDSYRCQQRSGSICLMSTVGEKALRDHPAVVGWDHGHTIANVRHAIGRMPLRQLHAACPVAAIEDGGIYADIDPQVLFIELEGGCKH